MSKSVARVYTNTSRRASRKQLVNHKPVYRSVLGNPFRVDWPIISPSLQQTILNQLIALFDGMAAYYQRVRDTRKKMRKKTRTATSSSHEQGEEGNASEPDEGPAAAPLIIPRITAGINEVTKALETEVRSSRQTVVVPSPVVSEAQALTSVIFICYADLDTPALVAHLPQLVALCNSARSETRKIKVVQLPAGAQNSLADALGYLKRVSVIALDDMTPGLGQLDPLLATVPDPPASWMTSIRGVTLEPSHVKQLLTTAPKDMKAAKELRAKGLAAAKERRRANRTSSLAHQDAVT